jgi:hypothetical protein
MPITGTGYTVPIGYVAINVPANVASSYRLDPNYPNNSNYNITSPSGFTYNSYLITQEYNTSYNFYDVRKVVVMTTMPFRQEYLPNLETSKVPGRLILTDYDVPINKWGDLDQTLYYIPEVYDRWVDITTNEEIRSISFDFKYEDLYGELNDLILQPGQAANIKLLFKSVY